MNLLDALIGTVAAPVKATGKVLSGENPLPEVMEGLSNFGTVLGTPGAMVTSAMAGENPLEAGLFDTDKRVGGRDLLERYKLAGENTDQGWFPDWGDAGGFAIDMVADPMNWLGGLGLAKKLMGISKAKAANRGIEAANALSKEQRAMGFMPEEVAKLTKIVDETGAPKMMYHGTANAWEGRPDPTRWSSGSLYGPGHYTSDSVDVTAGPDGYWKKGATVKTEAKRATSPDELIKELRTDRALSESLLGRAVPSATTREETEKLANRVDEMISRQPSLLSGRPTALHKLARHYQVSELFPEHAPSVQRSFIDSRNPFTMEDDVALNKFPDFARVAAESIRDNEYRKFLKKGYIKNDDLGELSTPIEKVSGKHLWDILQGITDDPNEAIRQAGYDVIQHVGGGNTGGAPHNVVIALDPSQVYLPYIAKELQDLQRVASPNSLLALLGGHNALAHTRFQGDDQ